MTSPLLALFIRSVREDSRLRFTYFSRATLVLLILLFSATIKAQLGWMNGPGLIFFGAVAHIDLCFVFLAGVSYFAAPISEEKEEQTLGLLRMTNLNPLSILLGKSTSRLCTAALLFAGQFPFTLLAITLGGVSLRQIVAVYLAIGAFLIFVSGLALLASVISRRTGTAGVLTGALLLVFLALGPIAKWLGQVPVTMDWLLPTNRWTGFFDAVSQLARAASPFLRIEDLLWLGRPPRGSFFFSAQFVSNLGLGLACFLLAWLAFERFCDDQRESASGGSRRVISRGLWRLFKPGRAWHRPLAWKEFHFTHGGKRWLAIKMVGYGVLLVLSFSIRWFNFRQSGTSEDLVDFGAFALGFAIICVFAELVFAASTIFKNEHLGQTLSSLAMLPQGIRRVAYQKVLGLVPALGVSIAYLVMSLPLFGAWMERNASDFSNGHDNVLGCAFYLAQAVFFLHLVAALSLRVRRGALPLAIGIEVLLFAFASWFFAGSIDTDSVIVLVILLSLAAAGFLHASIRWRLEELAGEG
jgi:hypothetical protein